MRLTNIKDCKNCANALVYGSKYTPIVTCNSSDYVDTRLFKESGRHCAGQCKSYIEHKGNRSGALEQNKALKFILAGNSEFILHSTKTNEDFIFSLVKETSRDNEEKSIYFVNIITGHDKIYAGILVENEETKEFEFKQGKNGQVASTNLGIRSLEFVLNKLLKNETVGSLEVYHLGKCGCCGVKLVTEENINSGFCKNHGGHLDDEE